MTEQAATHEGDFFYEALISDYVDSPRFVASLALATCQAKLKQPQCRFVLQSAEPGVGKSAFMAWVASNLPKWPRYFIRRDERTPLEDGGERGFFKKIGNQLSARFLDAFRTEAVLISVSQVARQARRI